MIVDGHQHVMLPTEEQLSLMDEAGVGKTVLFSATPHPERAEDLDALEKETEVLSAVLSGGESAERSGERAAEELAEVLASHPDRFVGFGKVPIDLPPEQTGEWMEEKVVGAGLKGTGEYALAPGKVADLERIFAASGELGGLPLWVHTFDPMPLKDIRELVRHRGVPLILGHLGGRHWSEAIRLAQEAPNVYLDLSATFTVLAPKMAIRALPERCIFGSDAPYGDPVVVRKTVERVAGDRTVARRVLGENAAELLGL